MTSRIVARHAGATVYTTARKVNHDYVRSLGAREAIDYAKENFVDVLRKREPGGIDVVSMARYSITRSAAEAIRHMPIPSWSRLAPAQRSSSRE